MITEHSRHTLDELKAAITIPEYLSRLGKEPRRVGRELAYLCIIHEDGKRGNLNYNPDKAMWFCQHCRYGGDIVELVGRELYRDVWNKRSGEQMRSVAERLAQVAGMPTPQKSSKSEKPAFKPTDMRETAVYPYLNAEGEQVFEKVRYEYTDEDGKPAKTFRLRRKEGKHEVYNLNGIDEKPPFQLLDLLAADPFEPIDITAGEKDAIRLKSIGRTAITNFDGEKSWDSAINHYLQDRDVIIWEDNDEAGREHTTRLRDELETVASSIKVIRPFDLPGLSDIDKGDVSDWLDMGHTADELHAIVEYVQPEPSRALAGWLTIEELATLPQMEPLISDVLFKDSLALLYSPTGSGKSFVVLDWAMSIAAGINWHGYETEPGMVAYIAAEGAKGMRLRVPAWIERRGVSPGQYIRFLPRPVEILNPQNVEFLIGQLLAMPEKPSLVVIDTFSWCFDGEENSNSDMAKYTKAIAQIRDATGACVLTIHHTGVSGDRERGATALKANLDTAIKLSSKNGNITLTCDKQKDGAAPFSDITLRLVPTEDGQTCTAEPLTVSKCATGAQKLRPSEEKVLAALASEEFENGCAPVALREKLGLSPRTVTYALEVLVDRGLIEKVGVGEYLITAAGLGVRNGAQ